MAQPLGIIITLHIKVHFTKVPNFLHLENPLSGGYQGEKETQEIPKKETVSRETVCVDSVCKEAKIDSKQFGVWTGIKTGIKKEIVSKFHINSPQFHEKEHSTNSLQGPVLCRYPNPSVKN